jgi:hypothetical protein
MNAEVASEMPSVLFSVALALSIAGGNVLAALVLARIAARQTTMKQFFKVVVGSLVGRSVLTLAAFGITFAQMASTQERFAFALAFILSYASLLAAEVVIIHRSQAARNATTNAVSEHSPPPLTRREASASADNQH